MSKQNKEQLQEDLLLPEPELELVEPEIKDDRIREIVKKLNLIHQLISIRKKKK
jgi:hypothetical protein